MDDARDSITSVFVSSSEIITGFVDRERERERERERKRKREREKERKREREKERKRKTEHKNFILFLVVCSSVDGCVRTYDIRAGELRTDHIGRKFVFLLSSL
jgi:transposase